MTTDPARTALEGAWRIVEYRDRDDETQPWTHTFGQRPSGCIVYHPSGLLSAQVFADRASPAAVAYVGYVGSFRMRESRRDGGGFAGVVEHHMEEAVPPELLDEDPARIFRVEGDRLEIGDGRTAVRVLERARAGASAGAIPHLDRADDRTEER